jgi:hypothetical protein
MNGQITKAELLTMIRTARARWETLLAEIPLALLTEPGVIGEWSIKDIIAHISWGERENIGVVRAHAVVGSELWQLSEDERNAAVFEQNRMLGPFVKTTIMPKYVKIAGCDRR